MVRELDLPRADARQHPRQPPPDRARGLAGGGDALPGRNWVERADGSVEELAATGNRPTCSPATASSSKRPAAAGLESKHELLAPARHPAGRRRLRAAAEPDAGGHRRGDRHRAARPGSTPLEVIATFGKAFNDNRIIAIVWIVLPVIGLLERFGLQQRAAAVIRVDAAGDHRASCCSSTSPIARSPPRSGCIRPPATPQTVRPLVAPMALAAAEKQHGELDEATAETGQGHGRRDRQRRAVLRRGHLLRHRLDRADPADAGDLRHRPRPLELAVWAIPTAIAGLPDPRRAAAAARPPAAGGRPSDHAALALRAGRRDVRRPSRCSAPATAAMPSASAMPLSGA